MKTLFDIFLSYINIIITLILYNISYIRIRKLLTKKENYFHFGTFLYFGLFFYLNCNF